MSLTQITEPIVASPITQKMPQTEAPQYQFVEVALHCLEKGWFVFPLGEKSKTPDGALAPNGFNSSSNDLNQIREWWTKSPNANIGIDLGRSNLTVLDFDNGKPPVELGLSDKFQVNTSRGTHVYMSGTTKQGDMHFEGEHVGEIKSAGGYVLSPFSVHPTGAVYSVAVQAAITPIPEGLIDRLRPQRKSSPSIKGEKIPRGSHDKELTRIAGKLRYDGMEENAIADALIEVCEKRCENYGSDYREMCKKIAKSVCRYPVGRDETIYLGGVPVSTSTTLVINESAVAQPKVEVLDDLSVDTIPAFQPYWVTGIYKKFVDVITRGTTMTPQFAFLAAKVVVGAKMAGKVKFENLDVEPRYYGAAIGETGSGKGEASHDANLERAGTHGWNLGRVRHQDY